MSLEDNLFEQRLARAQQIEALGYRPYGQRFDFTHTVAEIVAAYGQAPAEVLDRDKPRVAIAGRFQTIRPFGKAGFLHLTQSGDRLQVYVRKDAVPERDFSLYEMLDL